MNSPIVTTEWLNDNLENPNLVILDASKRANKSNLKSDIKRLQIPGALLFEIKSQFSDSESPFPNMLSKPEDFELRCQELGINNESIIVVYDNLGVYTSPRVWWMFKIMGHLNIHVLNGGLIDWVEKGFPTVPIHKPKREVGNFIANFQPQMVRNFNCIKENITSKKAAIVDARSEGRFNGTAPEPRAELQSGSIKNSINLPFINVLDEGKYKPIDQLEKIFSALHLSDQPLIFSCGSGITACIIYLAAEMVLPNEKSVYDGSWTEWALRNDLLLEVEENSNTNH